MDIKVLKEEGKKSTIVCGCGKVRTVFSSNLWKLKRQKRCNCKKEVGEKVPRLVIKREQPKEKHITHLSLQQMGFKPVRFKLNKPLPTEYTLQVCEDGRLVFEGCEIVGSFGDVWADQNTKRIALQSTPVGDVKYRNKKYEVKRSELGWTKPKKTYKVKGRYLQSVQAVVVQL